MYVHLFEYSSVQEFNVCIEIHICINKYTGWYEAVIRQGQASERWHGIYIYLYIYIYIDIYIYIYIYI
jgi:hypothetical protein